jgi:branched-chain amino acid transport system permease protein
MHSIALTVLVYMTLAVSWDMLLRSGQISFGIAGFFGLGAYGSALSMLKLDIPQMLSIPVGALVSFVVAFFIGYLVLRLRGMYFAIVTLALSEIFRVVMTNLHDFAGGPEGEILPQVMLGGDSRYMYWAMLFIAVITVIISQLFQKSRIHFALTAIRNDEIVAQSSGINIFRWLVFAFAITSALQGLVGGAYAQVYGFVTPESSFNLDFTLLPLAMALLGGIYGTAGPVIGAIILGVVAEYLKLYIPYGHLVIYGVIIVVVILFMPQGIVGLVKQFIKHRSKA